MVESQLRSKRNVTYLHITYSIFCFAHEFINADLFDFYSPLNEHSKLVRSTVQRARFKTFIIIGS